MSKKVNLDLDQVNDEALEKIDEVRREESPADQVLRGSKKSNWSGGVTDPMKPIRDAIKED